jgi:hypothetical protein
MHQIAVDHLTVPVAVIGQHQRQLRDVLERIGLGRRNLTARWADRNKVWSRCVFHKVYVRRRGSFCAIAHRIARLRKRREARDGYSRQTELGSGRGADR